MTRAKTKRMTIRIIESLAGPPDGSKTSNIEYSVSQESNLCLAVYKNGSRSWRFKQKFKGKRLFITIGPYPLFCLQDAVEKTRQYKRMIADGIDPRQNTLLEQKITLTEFITNDFIPFAKKHYKTFNNQQNMLDKRILKTFGAFEINEITKRQIITFHQLVCEETSGTTGNRHLSILSAIFKLAIEFDLLEKNPCAGVKKAKENKSRDRFLQEDEYVRFIQVLGSMLDKPQAQAIFLLLATGVRRSELLTLRWSEVSLPDQQAYIRDPKNGESRYAALNSVAVELLAKMNSVRKENSPWIFPARLSTSKKGHIQDVRKTFATVCKRANVTGLRLHDLRRSFASHLLSSGVDLISLQRLLGHKSLKSTTTYARVATSSLARSSEFAAIKIQKAMKQ